MDLNRYYSNHQIALIKAGAALGVSDRRKHFEDAADLAEEIGNYQRAHGAKAASSWRGRQSHDPLTLSASL